MISRCVLCAVASAAVPSFASAQSTDTTELIVQATAFESNGGRATIVLLNDPNAWQQMMTENSGDRESWKGHAAVADVPIQAGAAAVRFAPLQPGEYAVMVIHDENSNRKLDRNMMGMPKEELGVSNDYRMSGFPPRKPTWEDVKFTVEPGPNQKSLEMGMLRDMRR